MAASGVVDAYGWLSFAASMIDGVVEASPAEMELWTGADIEPVPMSSASVDAGVAAGASCVPDGIEVPAADWFEGPSTEPDPFSNEPQLIAGDADGLTGVIVHTHFGGDADDLRVHVRQLHSESAVPNRFACVSLNWSG